MTLRPLTAAEYAGETRRPDRIRLVHLGLGNFHRAHQAWFTAHASDAGRWGIAAFTGRTAAQADLLRAQDGLYHLVTRRPEGDRIEVVPSILTAHPADDVEALEELLADPEVALVTLTITEAGYRLDATGLPDESDDAVRDDLRMLRAAAQRGSLAGCSPRTTLARLLVGLDARRRAGESPLALVPCDNVPANGEHLERGLTALARAVSPALAAWIGRRVSFVSTSVDRITPRVEAPVAAVVAAGWEDRAPVVTEEFADWVLSGDFPAGRPRWEAAGARFVDEIADWENRKLWLLNGAHTILACAGLVRGHATVAEAIADPGCRLLVEEFWDEAVLHLGDDIEHREYRAALLDRFANPRIEHRLEQVAEDCTRKVRYRLAAVAERSRRAGRSAVASAAALGAWVTALDAGVLVEPELDSPTARDAVALVSPALAVDPRFLAAVQETSGSRPLLAQEIP